MSLQEKLDSLKNDFETNKAPPEAVAIMHRATADLIASGQAARALKVGDRAPAFALADPDGKVWSSADLLKEKPLVVTFYRGVWCPYCNLDLQALQAVAGKVRAAGANLVTISPQIAANSRKAQRDLDLSFPVLSDPGNEVADRFGLRFRLPEDLAGLYLKFGVDLARLNGDTSQTLPMPARYIIGRDGVIRYAEVNPDYTRRPDPQDLIPALAQG
jgi:peroxiredoxin